MKLIDYLKNFKGADSVDALTFEFKKLAPVFLYGGYIKVGDIYRIYIHAVEFYFHAEEGSPCNVSDPIVYHRDGKYNGRAVPYFPLLSLHAHASGYDITFENEEYKHRASALIRAYSIYDVKQNKFLGTKKEGQYWDDRSTYLYDYLNGFPINGNNYIEWVDEATPYQPEPKVAARRNVFEYENGQKTTIRD